MPQTHFFLRIRDLLVSQKTMQRHFFPTLHPLSTVIFATATVVAFVQLHNRQFLEITGEIIRKGEAPVVGHHFRHGLLAYIGP